MTCKDYKDLIMGYLDGELADSQKRDLETHIQTCANCRKEMSDFRRLIAITDEVTLMEPEDKLWEQYWGGIYNRIERGIGWIAFSLAAIVLLIVGGFKLIEQIIKDPHIGLALKAALLVLIVGLAILLASLTRERLWFWGRDRYKDVRR